MHWGHITAVVLAGSALYAAPAFANDSSSMMVGDSYVMTPNAQVALVREELRISLQDDRFLVHVKSIYRNDGLAMNVTMAFPENAHYLEGIQDFRSQIDGRPVNTEFHKDGFYYDYEEAGTEDGQTEGLIYGMPQNYRDSAWVKVVPFEAGQTREVVVDYWAEYGSNVYADYYAEYILATGASWAGPIESFACWIDWSALTRFSAPTCELNKPLFDPQGRMGPWTPMPWRLLSATEAVWETEQFEPDMVIHINVIQGFWNFTLNGEGLSSRAASYHQDTRTPLLREGSEVLGVAEDLCSYPWSPYSCFDNDAPPWDQVRCLRLGKDRKTLIGDCSGTNLVLAHAAVDRDGEWYVSVRDFIEALGGTYSWNEWLQRVELTLPDGPYAHPDD